MSEEKGIPQCPYCEGYRKETVIWHGEWLKMRDVLKRIMSISAPDCSSNVADLKEMARDALIFPSPATGATMTAYCHRCDRKLYDDDIASGGVCRFCGEPADLEGDSD